MYRSLFVPSLLSTAVLLAGCGGEDTTQPSPAAGERPAASVEQAEPSTSAPVETPREDTDAEIADAEGADAGTPTQAPVETPAEGADAEDTTSGGTDADGPGHDGSGSGSPGSASPGSGTEGLPGWPIESTPVHGETSWAAYVAVGAPGDPELQRVLEDVQQLWPGAGLGELGCDDGAATALRRSPTEHAVAVYFATEQHTTEFLRRWESPFVGVVRVTTLCAD